MTLKEASKHALTILKQVMEEKLNATNIEVDFRFYWIIKKIFFFKAYIIYRCLLSRPRISVFIYFLKKKSKKSLKICDSARLKFSILCVSNLLLFFQIFNMRDIF